MSNEIESNSSSPEDHWEIYVSYVDDHPAVILVDVGIAQVAPLEDKPVLVWLWVHVQAPDEEGFPTEEEDMKLNEIWTDYDYGFCTDLEPCEYCNAGISEECEQCREILEDKCSEISLQIK